MGSRSARDLEHRRGIVFYFSYVFFIAAFVAQCFVEPTNEDDKAEKERKRKEKASAAAIVTASASAFASATNFVPPSAFAAASRATFVTISAWTPGKESPAENASILSLMLFEWTTGLIRLGSKRMLKQQDLWNLSEEENTAAIGASFNANWNEELRNFLAKMKK